MLGWNGKATSVLADLADAGVEELEVVVVSTVPVAQREADLRAHQLDTDDISIRHIVGDDTSPMVLAEAEPGRHHVVLLLAGDWQADTAEADAKTIAAYLALSELLPADDPNPHLLVELAEPANAAMFRRRPAEVIQAGAFVSFFLANVLLRREVHPVVDALFASADHALRFIPAARFDALDEEMTFADLEGKARELGVAAVGVRLASERGRVLLSPRRDASWTLGSDDQVVVLWSRGARL
jgi:hypothetical protein